jgi:hypothetical protein
MRAESSTAYTLHILLGLYSMQRHTRVHACADMCYVLVRVARGCERRGSHMSNGKVLAAASLSPCRAALWACVCVCVLCVCVACSDRGCIVEGSVCVCSLQVISAATIVRWGVAQPPPRRPHQFPAARASAPFHSLRTAHAAWSCVRSSMYGSTRTGGLQPRPRVRSPVRVPPSPHHAAGVQGLLQSFWRRFVAVRAVGVVCSRCCGAECPQR